MEILKSADEKISEKRRKERRKLDKSLQYVKKINTTQNLRYALLWKEYRLEFEKISASPQLISSTKTQHIVKLKKAVISSN